MPPQQTREVIEAELNAPLEQIFEWINLEKPLGSASISQVLFRIVWLVDDQLMRMQHLGAMHGAVIAKVSTRQTRQCLV